MVSEVAARPVAIGSFVLGGFALAVVAMLVFSGLHLFTKSLRVMVVFQGSVAGLAVGSPVTFRGVPIGSVAGMSVRIAGRDANAFIPVYLDLELGRVHWPIDRTRANNYGLQHAIDLGLRAQLISESLVTGQLEVDFDFYPGTPATLSEPSGGVPEIPTLPSDLQHFKEQLLHMNLPELADNARNTLIGVQQVMNHLAGKIDPVADNIDLVAKSAQLTLDTATSVLRSLQADAGHTLGHIDQLADETQHQVTAGGRELSPVLANADKVSANANKLVTSLNSMVGQGAPMRSDLEASLRDLAASAASLRDLTRHLQRNPAGTVFGKSQP
jgi:paraquat-inducible protein B